MSDATPQLARPDAPGPRPFWRPALGAVLLFAVTSIPFVYAHAITPRDLVYTGLMTDVPDHAQYWSWVTASRTSLFISNTMTPEPNDPIFMNPWMWVLAQVQRAADLSFATLFQVWRMVATLLLVVCLAWFVREVIEEPTRRLTAVLVVLLGSGLGWALVVIKHLLGLSDVPYPLDVYVVEANSFWGLVSYPYVPLAQALILGTVTGAWTAHTRGRPSGFMLAVAGALALALFHAYDLITVYTVLGTWGVVVWLRSRALPRRLLLVGLAMGLTSGPLAWYYSRLTAHDPLWNAILAQYVNAGVWTPPHVHLVVLMGVPLLLAIVGLGTARRRRAYDLVACWALVSVVLAYLPTVFQIKMLAGWQFPLAVLAAHAWHDRLQAPIERGLATVRTAVVLPRIDARIVLVAAIVPTNVYLFAWSFLELSRFDRPYYLHVDEMAALDWLASHSGGDDVVLARLKVGQFVPNYGRTRAYLAHWAMTNRFFERQERVEEFFTPATPDARRREILEADAVTLVLATCAGPPPCDAASLDGRPWLEPVRSWPKVRLFRYEPGGRPAGSGHSP